MTDPIIFSSIGNYRIINYNSPFKGVEKFNGWIIETEEEQEPSSYLLKEFRWSTNNSNWSAVN